MKRQIFIVVPAPVPAGPIKGAYALANALAAERTVTLVTLKPGTGAHTPLDPRVAHVALAEHRGYRSKITAYRKLLRAAGDRDANASISMCLSADAVNLFCGRYAVTCSSVRGNLPQNYRLDYGLPGLPLAALHLAALRGMDRVVAMTWAMARQIARFTGGEPAIIGNFIDEAALEQYRTNVPATGPIRFVFLASFTVRKQPLLAVTAIAQLRERGHDAQLELIGSGPLRGAIEQAIRNLGLEKYVRIHGFLGNPYPLLGAADVFVLPSLSEGASRASLEALYLGLPCVLRATDGNAELVAADGAGSVFRRDNELVSAMLSAAEFARQGSGPRVSLLPAGFRQANAARAYLSLVEGVE